MKKPFKVAVIDLYRGIPNQGIRCIRELLSRDYTFLDGRAIEIEEFDARLRAELPDLSYDLYISSGGPGSPFDGVGRTWEKRYFEWLDSLWNHNQNENGLQKHALFICHSFEMMCRYFELGEVVQRKSASFGVFPVHKTEAGMNDPLFQGLDDPFFAADFRAWQVVQPDMRRFEALGASVLALEKVRPHVDFERALMAIRVSDHVVGVQFHPEADPVGMSSHFQRAERKAQIVSEYGIEKYHRIAKRLEDPAFLRRTYESVIPNLLRTAVIAGSRLAPSRHEV